MTNKLQDQLREAIGNYSKLSILITLDKDKYDTAQTEAWQKLDSLISQAVPMKALELAYMNYKNEICQEYCSPGGRHLCESITYEPQYWIDLAQEKKMS